VILKSFNYGIFRERSFGVASRIIRLLGPAALSVPVLLAAGCATRSSLNLLRVDMTAMQIELANLRQAQQSTAGELARVTAENRALEARLAEVTAGLRQSSADIARLRTRLDAAEAEAREARAKTTVPAAPTAVTPPPAPVPSAPPAAPPPRREPTPRAQSAEQVYGAALATFRSGEHGQAVLDFLDFIAKHPRHPLVANAWYWIGEAYYAQRDYRQALTEFQKVPATAPGSAKAADALLKIGLCQRSLRDDVHARQTWLRVVREFPSSEAAGKARVFLHLEPAAPKH
jgi:tol-pal system protein YbgF